MSVRTLFIRIDESDVGRVERDTHGRVTLRYESAWRTSDRALPLSLSLPLAAEQHRKGVDAYLWGLLPDNELILDQWAARFHTSARNAIGLLAHVGADCPGAVQFLTEEALLRPQADAVDWLDEAGIAGRLRDLQVDASLWRTEDDSGQFSLGGAQAKTAFMRRNGRWGIPSGRLPTTHIVKPGMRELLGHAENEHFCLSIARELGVPAAASTVEHFEDQTAIIVERYDRVRLEERIVRVHQEDFCQATATMPSTKYQNEGGPSAETIIDLLRTYSTNPVDDIKSFIDALVIAWAIVATDGHAKNYSLLHAPRRVRLAPLYDVASILPYADVTLRRVKLAMSIGGKYRVNEVGIRQWRRFAEEVGVGEDLVRASITRILESLPDAATHVRNAMKRSGLGHAAINKLADAIPKRARSLAKEL